MEGKKIKDLKNESFDSIQKMFDRDFKRVNTFVDFRTDLVKGSSKRAGEELEQESTKKQKVDEDKDTTELQSLMEVIPDEEEVAIDAVPLAIKSLRIQSIKVGSTARLSREAWVQSMDASDTVHSEVRALRTTVLAQKTKIGELRAADRKRQTQLIEALTLLRTLQT
ncbi:hypothetical protein Tco_0797121 [Tanacetum coccineum]